MKKEREAQNRPSLLFQRSVPIRAFFLFNQPTTIRRLFLLTLRETPFAGHLQDLLDLRGAKKGTPFAAAKVGETVGAKALAMGIKEVAVVVKGTGSGRESGIRGFIGKGINLVSVKDTTPVPHNGPKPKKPRRV